TRIKKVRRLDSQIGIAQHIADQVILVPDLASVRRVQIFWTELLFAVGPSRHDSLPGVSRGINVGVLVQLHSLLLTSDALSRCSTWGAIALLLPRGHEKYATVQCLWDSPYS